jgi:hypothetical protein
MKPKTDKRLQQKLSSVKTVALSAQEKHMHNSYDIPYMDVQSLVKVDWNTVCDCGSSGKILELAVIASTANSLRNRFRLGTGPYTVWGPRHQPKILHDSLSHLVNVLVGNVPEHGGKGRAVGARLSQRSALRA